MFMHEHIYVCKQINGTSSFCRFTTGIYKDAHAHAEPLLAIFRKMSTLETEIKGTGKKKEFTKKENKGQISTAEQEKII